jgi:selenocysteine lyase/cysteine desulfurase
MKSDHSTLFSAAENIYLLSHSIGRMPASTKTALQDNYFSHWESNQNDIWDHWLASIDEFRTALATLFNASSNCFCPQSNISSGLGKVVQALPKRKDKNVILMCEADFPSAGFVLQQAQSNGFELKVLPADADIQNIDTWEQALTADVHTVFITHVQYGTSKRAPVSQICELARSRGTISIVDVAQSAGVVPIDISRWGCDVVSGSCIKWLCGGPGAGYLWVSQELVGQLEPADVGWFSHANPFEFDINNFEYAKDSARLWGGTPSVMPYVAAANSIKLIDEVGVSVVQQHNQSLIDALSESISPDSLISPLAGDARGGTLVVKFKHRAKVEQRLNDAGICYDSRAQGLRFSPHIYNTEKEIQLTKQCLEYRP